jgi:histidine ammonia-lyase
VSSVALDGGPLSLEATEAVARRGAVVRLGPEARARL